MLSSLASIMPERPEEKTLEEKYGELLRAFCSLNTKVNNNKKRREERISNLESTGRILQVKTDKIQTNNHNCIEELEAKKSNVEMDIKAVEQKRVAITAQIDEQTKHVEYFEQIRDKVIKNHQAPVATSNLPVSNTCKQSLQRHTLVAHPTEEKCPHCEQCFKTGLELERHMNENHETNALKCKQCKAKFFMKWRLRKHMIAHTSVKTQNCHFFNNDRICPYELIGCKFNHQFLEYCKFAEGCRLVH